MIQKFDVIVIGTGEAGGTVANKCRKAGWTVAIIDSRPYGGTCALRGCDPKKVLVGAAELVDWHRRMKGNGIKAQDVQIDWNELMQFKSTFTEPVPKNSEKSFTRAGMTLFHGHAKFESHNSIQVGEQILEGQYIVLATGAMPRNLDIPGAELVTTSTEFLELNELPKRIVFIGGGYISFEFAHIAVRAGVNVSILQRGKRPLDKFDPDLVDELVSASRELQIDIRLQVEVTAIEKTENDLSIQITGSDERFHADMVVHGAGRVPDIDHLDLAKAGIERNLNGIIVNEYLQSVSNSAIYAAGDAAATKGPSLTPVAVAEGHVVASNLLKGNHRIPDYNGVSSVVFTIPALASVGLLENEARKQGLQFKVNYHQTSKWYAARRTNEKHTGFKVLIEEKTGRILGAHLLGTHAEEVINFFGFAMRNNLLAASIKTMIYAYPTSTTNISYMV